MNTDYDNEAMQTREYQRASRAAKITEQIRSSQTQAEVLSTIDELNQYLLGNVTIEAATDAARELYYKLNEKW
mgnify:FL=1